MLMGEQFLRTDWPWSIAIATYLLALLPLLVLLLRDRRRPWRSFGQVLTVYAAAMTIQSPSIHGWLFLVMLWLPAAWLMSALVLHGWNLVEVRASVVVNEEVVRGRNAPAGARGSWSTYPLRRGGAMHLQLRYERLGALLLVVIVAFGIAECRGIARIEGLGPHFYGNLLITVVPELLALAWLAWWVPRKTRMFRGSVPIVARAITISAAFRDDADADDNRNGRRGYRQGIAYEYTDLQGRPRRFTGHVRSIEPVPDLGIEPGDAEEIRLIPAEPDRVFWRGTLVRAERPALRFPVGGA